MKESKIWNRFRGRFILFLIPLYTLIISSVFLSRMWPFYMSEPDPSYVYLFNGMNLASGNMEVGHIDHPGTTVQCLSAIIIFVKHLFASNGLPLYQDVISNPESYLFTCSIVFILLFVCINLLTGLYIYKNTASMGLGIVFQLVPLINSNIIRRLIMLNPESVIIIVTGLFCAYLFVKSIDIKNGVRMSISWKNVLVLGIASGFLIASKYTCFPVIILVLFCITRWKQRLMYVGFTILSFFLFVIPALFKFHDMFQWVKNLITHDDVYGKGAERIINPEQFSHNISGIFLADTVFTAVYILISIAFVVSITDWLRKDNPFVFTHIITGVWLTCTTLIVMVAKHCEFHYLIFAECCFPMGIAIAYEIFQPKVTNLLKNKRKYAGTMWGLLLAFAVVFLIIEKIRYIPIQKDNKKISESLAPTKVGPVVVSVNSGLACAMVEPALFLGYMYSGNLQGKYAGFLRKKYPETFIYWNASQTLSQWNDSPDKEYFFQNNKKITLYLDGYDEVGRTTLLAKIRTMASMQQSDTCKIEKVLENVQTKQGVYQITVVE